MTDISYRMRVLMDLDAERSKRDKGLPYSELIICAAELYLLHNPAPTPHDFLTLSQPKETEAA